MTRKPTLEQAKKLTFRLGDEHGQRVLDDAIKYGVSPNQVGKIKTIIMIENRFDEFD